MARLGRFEVDMSEQNLYSRIIERIFGSKYSKGSRQVEFTREDLVKAARALRLTPPKNLGDLVYSFRYRTQLPASIRKTAGTEMWIIRPAGRAKYRFVLVASREIVPNPNLSVTKVPDATPGMVSKYALSDEQALLAKLRYNRLIDIFLGVTCYSLQNHLRTTAPSMGQVETDELYVGIDRRGAQYVVPVQAKGGKDKLSIVQIEQDMAVSANKFPGLLCRPVGAQFMADDLIAMFEFVEDDDGVAVASEKHYKLVPPEAVTREDIEKYGLLAE